MTRNHVNVNDCQNLMGFTERIDYSKKKLCELEEAFEELIRAHEAAEEKAEKFPLEIRESDEDKSSRHGSVRKECIRLEEMLVRLQIALDGTSLPRKTIEDREVPDPDARSNRKQIVQEAESLIQKLQNLRASLFVGPSKL